jgi:cation diffusion facilitator CzcD-associated flavoprotein CzcO
MPSWKRATAIGGTWDLFRYPGIRSDSDMYTLGYGFKPWLDAKAIADGPAIRAYIRDTARQNGIEPHIRFGHKVGAPPGRARTRCGASRRNGGR